MKEQEPLYTEWEAEEAIMHVLGRISFKRRARIIIELKQLRQDRLAKEKAHTSDSKPIVSTTRLSTRGQLVIPEKVRNHLGWKEGDKFMVMAESGRILIIKEVS